MMKRQRRSNAMTALSTSMMPAGEYYVGDLCYVLGDSRWDEVCAEIIVGSQCLDGVFELADGVRFAMFSTAWGDGEFQDQEGHSYCVDAGSIGCVLTTAAGVDLDRAETLGRIVTFKKDFLVYEEDGKIHIGPLTIDTDPAFEENDYEDEEAY
jgi:hypothetical protein